MKRSLRHLRQTYPGLVEGYCYSVWDLSTHPEKVTQMLQQAETCDFGIVYFHGGAQTLPDFPGVWSKLSAKMPTYFESSLPEEIAELLPQSGLTETEYQNIRQYFRLADEQNFSSMLLHIASSRFGAKCTVPEPLAPLEEGFYRPTGILDEAASNALRRSAAESGKCVIGLILHQTHIMNGNTRHIDAILSELDTLDVIALPLFTRMANDEDDKRGVRHAMERYFMWEGKKLPDVIMVMTGFSLTHMGWPGDGFHEMTKSIFAAWQVPAIQVLTTRLSAEDYAKLPQGMDSMSLSTNIFQPELDG
ncbi:MAG: cobaltochelatase subunit CobN, partial [Oscillospiraceae bacterium]|nr:cobaltochelatase subunit CobN [Oscillospiraceae bacterium]